jgi:hypothetical protein
VWLFWVGSFQSAGDGVGFWAAPAAGKKILSGVLEKGE